MSDERNGGPDAAALDETQAPVNDETSVSDEAFQEELGRLQHELDTLREMYLRKLADFDNYRKRQEREMEEFRRLANAGLIRECLPVLDNLERALSAPGDEAGGVREGVQLVLRQFQDVLARHGLEQIDPLGAPFDPTLHEAIAKRPAAGCEDNAVCEVLQKGYRLGERLLRPALVVVAAGAAGATGGEAASE